MANRRKDGKPSLVGLRGRPIVSHSTARRRWLIRRGKLGVTAWLIGRILLWQWLKWIQPLAIVLWIVGGGVILGLLIALAGQFRQPKAG